MGPAWPALQSQDTLSFPHQTTSLSPNGTTQRPPLHNKLFPQQPLSVLSVLILRQKLPVGLLSWELGTLTSSGVPRPGIVCPCTLPSSLFSTGARTQDLSYMLGKSPTTELHPQPVLLSFLSFPFSQFWGSPLLPRFQGFHLLSTQELHPGLLNIWTGPFPDAPPHTHTTVPATKMATAASTMLRGHCLGRGSSRDCKVFPLQATPLPVSGFSRTRSLYCTVSGFLVFEGSSRLASDK